MDNAKARIGELLKELRTAQDMTQEDLAELIGKTAGAVGQLERGDIYPHYETLAKIIHALGVDANLFFFREESNQSDLSQWMSDLFYNMTDSERKSIGLFLKKCSSAMLKRQNKPV
jgi:transcriptional regulator with XRE-family HTH domain